MDIATEVQLLSSQHLRHRLAKSFKLLSTSWQGRRALESNKPAVVSIGSKRCYSRSREHMRA